MELKIDRDEEKCLECMFKDTDFHLRAGVCLLFKNALESEIKYGSVDHWIPCNECNLVWRK